MYSVLSRVHMYVHSYIASFSYVRTLRVINYTKVQNHSYFERNCDDLHIATYDSLLSINDYIII